MMKLVKMLNTINSISLSVAPKAAGHFDYAPEQLTQCRGWKNITHSYMRCRKSTVNDTL